MERSRAPVARDRFAPYRFAERPRARRYRQPSAEIRGGEMSWDTCEGFTNICRASKGGDGGLWQVDVIRRDGQPNAHQPGDVTTCTDLCSPHRFGEAAPERVTRNG